MFHPQISIQKRDAKWDELVALAENGMEVLILDGNNPLFTITPVDRVANLAEQPARKDLTDSFKGRIRMREDFDDPMPDEFWFGEDS